MKALSVIFLSVVILIFGLIIYNGAITVMFGEVTVPGTNSGIKASLFLKLLQYFEGNYYFLVSIWVVSGLLFLFGSIVLAIRIKNMFFR